MNYSPGDGVIVTPAVTETIETNEFAGAEEI